MSIRSRVDVRTDRSANARIDARTDRGANAPSIHDQCETLLVSMSIRPRVDARTDRSVNARIDARTDRGANARIDARIKDDVNTRTLAEAIKFRCISKVSSV